ncbi:MAG: hypothetical protein ACOY82_20475 [Pseudomonadota bacterium]
MTLTLTLTAAWSLSASAAALTPDMTPEAVATEAYARMRAGDWAAAAEAFDPEALRGFRGMFQPLLDGKGGDGLAAAFFGTGRTTAEVAKMNDAEFFAGFIRSVAGGMGGMVSLGEQRVLGGVPEGDNRTHLVVRAHAEAMGLRITQMEVVTLNRTPQGWRLAMSGEMEGFAQMMQKMMNAGPEGVPMPPPAAPRDP